MVDLSRKTKGRSVDMGRISLPCLYDGPRMINKKLDDLLSLLDFIWVQCFEPTWQFHQHAANQVKGAPGLPTLIVREARRCGGKGWLAYDTMFRQQAVGNPEVEWPKLNPTLYAVTFLAQSGSGRNCVLCMESDHSEDDCALAKGKGVHASQRLHPVGIPSEVEWKLQVVHLRGSQGWSVFLESKGVGTLEGTWLAGSHDFHHI